MLDDKQLAEYSFYLPAEDLPTGWTVASLADVSNKITDGTHKTPDYQSQGVRFISIKNIRPYKPVNWSAYEKYITRQEHEALTKRCKPEFDDILFPRIGTLGFAKRIDFKEEVSIFVGLGLIKPKKDIVLPRFVEFYMNTSYIDQLSRTKANGSGRMTLPLAQTKKFPIPIPPTAEQQRIVEKIETLFAELDKGEEALRAVQKLLVRYRQSVLKAAVTGTLTRQSAANWKPVVLGDLLEDIRYGTAKKCLPDVQGTAVLRIPNVVGGAIDLSDLKFAELTDKELGKLALREGDVLIVRSNGSANLVGRGAIVTPDAVGMAYAGYLIRLRLDRQRIHPAFLHIVLNSPSVRARIERQAKSTSGVHNLNSAETKAIAFDLPDIDTQATIVEAVEEAMARIEQGEAWCETELQRSAALRQSILKDAFSGKLVQQDPSDEPAEKLLQRIRASRADKPRAKRKKTSA
ncbi:restriction endonuclease subunit S [Erythrobacter sp. HA6-11]